MKVVIVGGGNLGHYIAAKLGASHDVYVYTNKYEQWSNEVEAIDVSGEHMKGNITIATNLPNKNFFDADIIFITWPTNVLANRIKEISNYINPPSIVCFCPGYGGKEFISKSIVDKGVIITGTQRVFSSTKILEYGKTVECIDNRPSIKIGTINLKDLKKCQVILSNLFDKPCFGYKNYLNVTLTPSNPVLHTARIYTLFNDYSDGRVYDRHFKFYSTWSYESSRVLLRSNQEVQNICAKLQKLDLSGVTSLREHYEINSVAGLDDAERMTNKLRSLKFLKDQAPMVYVQNGYIPDFSSRYFQEDFRYGLAVIQDFGRILSVETSQIDQIMDWFKIVTGNSVYPDGVSPLPSDNEVNSLEKIYSFYS